MQDNVLDLSFLLAVNDTVSKVPYCHASNLLCLFASEFVCIVIYLFVNCQRHSLHAEYFSKGSRYSIHYSLYFVVIQVDAKLHVYDIVLHQHGCIPWRWPSLVRQPNAPWGWYQQPMR